LGISNEPVSTAHCYEGEAPEVHGSDGIVTFPSASNGSPAFTGMHLQASVVAVEGIRGHGQPGTSKSLPPGNAEGIPGKARARRKCLEGRSAGVS
jgi:hypothetical protein